MLGGAAVVLAADVERQQAALAAVVDQRLGDIEVALVQTVRFQQIAPAAR